MIAPSYNNLRATIRRRTLEAKREAMGQSALMISDFDELVRRAVDDERVSISRVAVEMSASRTTVYQMLDRARHASQS
jgi:predicted DNA-binding protein (UPF0251 family)